MCKHGNFYFQWDIECGGHRYYPANMAYHVFELNPFQQLKFLQSHTKYRDAKQFLRECRTSPDLVNGTTYRMMFANDPQHAEKLLREKREPRPMGEHD